MPLKKKLKYGIRKDYVFLAHVTHKAFVYTNKNVHGVALCKEQHLANNLYLFPCTTCSSRCLRRVPPTEWTMHFGAPTVCPRSLNPFYTVTYCITGTDFLKTVHKNQRYGSALIVCGSRSTKFGQCGSGTNNPNHPLNVKKK